MKNFIAMFMLLLFLAACSDDSDPISPDPSTTTFTVSIENLTQQYGIMSNGIFNTPVGASAPGPILSGGAYEFDFSAAPGYKLSLATMFVQSNDLFYGPGEAGIDLFDGSGNPITGDVTAQIDLWDSGTEINEIPGIGLNQAPRQSGPNTGAADPDNTVRFVTDGFTYPDVADAIRVTLTANGGNEFTARIENVGTNFDFIGSGVFNTPVGAGAPGPIGPGGSYEINFDAAPGSKLTFANMFIPSNDFFYAPDGDGIELFDGSGNQISGDITSQIELWDSGTEENEEPGLGANQPQRGSGNPPDADTNVRLAPDTFSNLPAVADVIQATLTANGGTSFTLTVTNVSTSTTLATSDGNTQAVPLSPGVFVIHGGSDPIFTVGAVDRGEGLAEIAESGNPGVIGPIVAANTGINVILAPGTFAVHAANAPFFTVGQPDRGEGLEDIAEDGNPGNHNTALSGQSGLFVPFSPGIYMVHNQADPYFTVGEADRGQGLEAIAEDGDPTALVAALQGQAGISSVGAFNTPVGASAPGPIGPNGVYEFTVEGVPGDYVNFASMFIQSNDLFVGPDGRGIPLFDGDSPRSGDVTSEVLLWDAGTEVNERPGVGPNQAPRQSGANTGAVEGGVVQEVNDGFVYPSVIGTIRVTLTVQ